MNMNVVIWGRIPSRKQREGRSIDVQLRACRKKAKENGGTVVREFRVAESAKHGPDRKAFNEMLAWIKAHAKREKIGLIFSHELDRCRLNTRDAARLQKLVGECGVYLVFVRNTPKSKLRPKVARAICLRVMAAEAKNYSDGLRWATLKGMEERVRQGWPTGRAPYGYRNVDDPAKPVQPDPAGSKALVRIFKLFATGQHTERSLGDKLAQEGFVYRPSRHRFNRSVLSHILSNRFYVGELHRNGNVHTGKHRTLISRRAFDLCQEILNGKNRRISHASKEHKESRP